MKKFIKVDFLLNMEEYNDIKECLKGNTHSLYIEKEETVIVDNENYDFTMVIENKKYQEITVNIFSTAPELLGVDDEFSVNKISRLICVRELIFKHYTKKDSYNFFVNIDKKYDKSFYPYKVDYDISKLNILKWRGKYDTNSMYKEIAYQDFSTEFSMALASYCLFTNSQFLLEDSYVFDLYDEKLSFNGFYIEDFVNTSITSEYTQCLELIDKCETKTEIFEIMLMYIATIKYGTPSYKSSIIESEVSNIGYELYESYLKK